MNKIHNPFLKCWLVDNIINLFYQKKYTLQKKSYNPGKTDIKSWHKNLCKYCDEIAKWERKVYPQILSAIHKYHTDVRDKNTFSNIYKEYKNLAGKYVPLDSKSRKRGALYPKILKEIVIKDYERIRKR